MAKFASNASGAMLLPSLVQVSEAISGSVVPLAMFVCCRGKGDEIVGIINEARRRRRMEAAERQQLERRMEAPFLFPFPFPFQAERQQQERRMEALPLRNPFPFPFPFPFEAERQQLGNGQVLPLLLLVLDFNKLIAVKQTEVFVIRLNKHHFVDMIFLQLLANQGKYFRSI